MPSRWREVMRRVFGRRHPDVYSAAKAYAEKEGKRVEDVIGAAVAAYLSSNDEGRAELEKAMADRALSGGESPANVKASLNLFKDVCGAMGEMFKSMNEARAGMSVSSMLADFKAVAQTMEEVKKAGSESGTGSLTDSLASAFIEGILKRAGGQIGSKPGKKKSGKASGKVSEVEE